jgi:hypothetical protein
VANWLQLEDNTIDPRAVELTEYGESGKWLLSSCSDPLADLAAQVSEAQVNRFNEVTDVGGQVTGSMDLYRLPLMDGYQLATEDEYVAAWNAAAKAVPGSQLIPEGN